MKIPKWKLWVLRRIGLDGVVLVDPDAGVDRYEAGPLWDEVAKLYDTKDVQINAAIRRVLVWTARKLDDLRTGRETPW